MYQNCSVIFLNTEFLSKYGLIKQYIRGANYSIGGYIASKFVEQRVAVLLFSVSQSKFC